MPLVDTSSKKKRTSDMRTETNALPILYQSYEFPLRPLPPEWNYCTKRGFILPDLLTPALDISKEFVVPKYWTSLMTFLCTLICAVTYIELFF